MRLIDAEALIHRVVAERDSVEIKTGCDIGYHNGLNTAVSMAINAPTVDAVVLPCKPGDTVFVLWRLADPDICSKCPDFHWGGMGDSHECGKTEDGFRSAECVEIQEWTANRDRILDWIRFDEFGRTVFPTREEAEAALAKRRNEHET